MDNGTILALFAVTKCQLRRYLRKPEHKIEDKDFAC